MPSFVTHLDLIFSKPVTKDLVKKEKELVDNTRGVYFWFADQEALEKLGISSFDPRLYTYNVETNLYYLVYIGIGPRDDNTKKQFLRKRIVDCHLGNKICNSTFRQSLSALLEHEPQSKQSGQRSKICIPIDKELEVTSLITTNFALGVQYHKTPWDIENYFIENYQPPINLKGNKDGWFFKVMDKVRTTHRESAKNNILR